VLHRAQGKPKNRGQSPSPPSSASAQDRQANTGTLPADGEEEKQGKKEAKVNAQGVYYRALV